MYLLHLSSMHHPFCGLVSRPFHGPLVRVITILLDLRVACPILSYLVRFILARRYIQEANTILQSTTDAFTIDAQQGLRVLTGVHIGIVEANARCFSALVSAKYNMHYSANVSRREQTLFSRRISHSTVVAIFSNSQYCRCQSLRGRFTFNPARGVRACL